MPKTSAPLRSTQAMAKLVDVPRGRANVGFESAKSVNQLSRHTARTRRMRKYPRFTTSALLTLAVAAIPTAVAQNCIPLAGSALCQAFNQSSISTSSEVSDLFGFLAFVSDVQSFDTQLQQYINTDYAKEKYDGYVNYALGC